MKINEGTLPQFFLVLTGPKAAAGRTAGKPQPWCIEEVYLFNAASLVNDLKTRGVKLGVAASIRSVLWNAARIYPEHPKSPWNLTELQKESLRLFRLSSVAIRL